MTAQGQWVFVEAVIENRIDDPDLGGMVVTIRNRDGDPEVERRVRDREDRYRQIAELSLEGVWCIDEHGVTTFVTRRMAAMLGYDAKEMIGRPIFDFMDEGDRPEAEQRLARRKEGRSDDFECALRHRTGREVWTHMAATPVTGPGGHVIGAIALVSDVTDQHQTAIRLVDSEAHHQALLNAIPDIVYVIDSDYVIRARHAGVERPFVLASSVVGQSIRELIPEQAAEAEAAIDRTLRTGGVHRFEFTFENAGRVRAYEARGSRISPTEVMVLVRDVTEIRDAVRTAQKMASEVRRRRAAEEQAEMERRLARVARFEALGRLAGGVAHDMNNLLGVVGNYAAAIRSSSSEPHIASDAEEIARAVRRGTELTRRLLLFGRRDGAAVRVQDVRAVTVAVCRMLTRTLGSRHPVEVAFSDGEMWAAVDRWQLEQAIINLVINAQDASAEGSPIEVSVSPLDPAQATDAGLPGGDWLCLSVSDRGHGIPADLREKVLEPFFTTKAAGQGSGLGLSVVQGMATDAGGSLAIHDRPGGGTTVCIYLPAAEPVPQGSEDGRELDITEHHGPADRAGRRGARLLVVDDEDAARRSVSRMLTAHGYQVAEAASADQALQALAENLDIDAVVTDVVMPGISGPDLAGKIRAQRPDLPVVLMTGYGADLLDGVPEDIPLLAKPLELDRLIETLDRLLVR